MTPGIEDLDAATVTMVVRAQFPQLAAAPAELLGEGRDYRVFRVVAGSG